MDKELSDKIDQLKDIPFSFTAARMDEINLFPEDAIKILDAQIELWQRAYDKMTREGDLQSLAFIRFGILEKLVEARKKLI